MKKEKLLNLINELDVKAEVAALHSHERVAKAEAEERLKQLLR